MVAHKSTERLLQDQRELLLPWIGVMLTNMSVELAHFLYFLVSDTVRVIPGFDPRTDDR